MGQLLGKARLREAAQPFANLDQQGVYLLWEAFNDVAEGFGINVDELTEICMALQNTTFMHAPKQVILKIVESVFTALDTDQNNLVDSLEALVTLCMLSGMELRDKAKFCFQCYDFDESGEITVDELTLLLKSCATGLCKLDKETPIPEEIRIEQVAQEAFRKSGKSEDVRITCEEFVDYCCTTPELIAWCDFFDDALDFRAMEQYSAPIGESAGVAEKRRASKRNVFAANEPLDDVLMEEAGPVSRPGIELRARDPDSFKMQRPTKAEREAAEKLVRPWKETASMTVPSHPPTVKTSQPNEDALALDWVHGYSAQHARGTLRYTAAGDLVYNAACVGVVYSLDSHEQRFNLDHTDEIRSLALHPDSNTVATGERGHPPKIHIWDASTMKIIVTLRGAHAGGIGCLAFSPEQGGRWLVSVGQDPEHTVALYDWEARTLVFSAKSTRSRVLSCIFRWPAKETSAGAPPTFVTCGEDHMSFWNQDDNRRQKKGVFGKIGAPQSMLSLACHPKNNRIISGSLSGHLYVWDGNRNLQRTIKGHDSAVTALYFHSTGLLSGGADGKIRLWSLDLEQGAIFDVAGLGSLLPSVSSVCYSDDASKILVGTRAGEIFEMSAEDGSNLHPGPLATGHFYGELHGLAMHPHKPEYCTVGDDQTVRIWDIATRRMTRMVKIDTKARACAYSPDGSLIAVGLGGTGPGVHGGASKKDGAFVILNEADLCIVHEARDSKKWIAEVKFSADGETLGIGSADKAIYLYNVEDFASKGKAKGHHGIVVDMDFSEDNQCIQSTCTAGDLLYWNANTGEQYKKPSTMRDVEWTTQTTPVGWACQGMWSAPGALDIVSVARARSSRTILAGDCVGRLRLFRNPVPEASQGFHEYRGHASAVRRVRFSFDDAFAISVGKNDRCLMQWRHESDHVDNDDGDAGAEGEEEEQAMYVYDPDSEDEMDYVDGAILDRDEARDAINNRQEDRAAADSRLASDEYFDDTDEEREELYEELRAKGDHGGEAPAAAAEGDEDGGLPERPWVRLAVAPSVPPREDPTAPEEDMTLEWVHGCNVQVARNSVMYLNNGDIAFPAASLGVILSKQGGGVQRFFTDHSDQVVSLCLHPEGKLLATAQMGRVPKIVIWDAETMEAVQTLVGYHKRGVIALRFSRDGDSLVSAGLDDEHSVAVYDWKNGIVSVHCSGGEDKVLDIDFRPDGLGLVQCGVNHVKFHELRGRNVLTRRGLLGKKGKLQVFYSIAWAGTRAVVSTADGHLYAFEGRTLHQSVKGHEGAVLCVYSCGEGLVSGGKDGFVRMWTPGLEMKAQFEVSQGLHSIRSVCWSPEENRIVVANRACEIVEISAADGTDLNNGVPVIQGHYKHELWGLAMHPTKPEYCTVGDDQMVRVWDVATHKMLKSVKLDTMARAVTYSPDGSKIAIGLGARVGKGRQKKDGSFVVLNEKDLVMVHEGRNSKQWITDIKYSPDGATLAVGSYDNSVYLYDIGGGYAVKGVFEGHNSYITHLDLSVDGQFVQTNCGAYELKYCDANSGTGIPAVSTLKDVQWASWTCPLGWPVKGVHPANSRIEINAVHRNSSGQLVLAGDEYGRVELYRYPCIDAIAGHKTYRGHAGDARNARFTCDDAYAITVGGQDRCIMQWRLELGEEEVAVAAGESGRDSDLVFEAKGAGPEGVKGSGDSEFVTVRPWLSAVVPPTGAPSASENGDEAPKGVELELDFVYGHRSHDVRNNLRYNCIGQIVYFGAAVGIVYDKARHEQAFYMGHDGRPMISLAMHPSGKFVATGEGSCTNRRRPGTAVRVHIWNAMTGAAVMKLPALHSTAASQLCFSADGSRLISVGEDENHTIMVWRSDSGTWTDTNLQAKAMGGQQKILFALFYGASELATGGVNHLTFWKLNGGVLTPRRGIFGRKGKVQPLLCAATLEGVGASAKIVTGSVTGHLYVWSDGEVIKSVKAHDRTVNAIHACNLGLATGSKDGVVKLWDSKLSPIRTFDMSEVLPTPHRPPVRSVCWDSVRGTVLVGTQGSEIYELTTANQSAVLISQGHAMDELHGLAPSPKDPNIFATAGDDQTVRLWDASKRRMIGERNVGCMTRAVCWSPDGATLGIGLGGTVGRGRQKKDGVVMVLRGTEALDLLHETRDSKEWIADAKYSPDGETLAVASYDNKIYMYDVNKNYELRAKCEGHNSFVLHIDFSEDSEYIRSNCGGYDLLFHKVEDGSVVNSPSMLKDIKWATTTCSLCWSVQGIWPEVTDSTVYNACDASPEAKLVAATDDLGFLNIFSYPAITKGSHALRYRAHVSQVMNTKFNKTCEYVFTAGGPDRILCQWRVMRSDSSGVGALSAEKLAGQDQEEKKDIE
ncbi:Echinoderm microtubule-associated protein-like 1 [Hondaea fermentalgiana]|uniref:Echinoderm microtubule-associated protein-like 1 n=1 Tax=Hondaea fermentalgiana TaxID=2315210 RepID=A0A2R5G5S9_9STRA|nr:Echinoderm microtubule-associated protein-like 1 [Hondaea fermentalgiana]|eukprot:GBG25699.1 Echinoderm microtubule-associated protein-like 1 [Hondaea fermentalgiana]